MDKKYLLIILVMVAVFIYSFYRLSDRYTFEAHVVNLKYHNSDAIDYQLIAVNVVDGYGITAHFIEEYSRYKMGIGKKSLVKILSPFKFFNERFNISTDVHVWKPPGYPLFLALIYKFVGINPFYVMFIQFILLALAASFMPLISFLYWGEIGIISGMVASIVFINSHTPNPTLILAEALYVFLFAVWILLLSVWEKRHRIILTALLGLILGIALLVKGSCVFIVFLFPMYLFFKLKQGTIAFKHAVVFVFCLAAMIAPWSIYASIREHRPILLCDQVMPDLLAGNNEQSIQTGEYTPEWKMKNADYLYKRLQEKKYSDGKMLMIFLSQNYKYMPQLLVNKINAMFYSLTVVLSLMLLYYLPAFYSKCMNGKQGTHIPVFPLIFFMNIFLITLIAYGRYLVVLPFVYPFLIPAAYAPFYLVIILSRRILGLTFDKVQ